MTTQRTVDKASQSGTEKRELSLEEIIHLANRIGLEYVDKKQEAERLELMRTTVRARIMNRIENQAAESDQKLSENKLKRMAEADPEYVTLLENMATARAEAEKLKVRYDSYRHLFEAQRTMLSYRRTELKTL